MASNVVFDLSTKNTIITYKSTMARALIPISGFGAGSIITFDTADAISAEAGADGLVAKWINPAAGIVTGTMNLRGSAPALFDILNVISDQWNSGFVFRDGILTIALPNGAYVATLDSFTFDSQARPISIGEKIEDYSIKVSFAPPGQFSLAGSVAILSAIL
jgi:hypothetical protein